MTTTEAVGERERVLCEVELAHRAAIDAGMDVLRDWAAKGAPFSSNDVRSALRAAGVKAESAGALFNAALRARMIRRCGDEMSTDERTRHRVNRYIGTGVALSRRETVAVPVQRNRAGRFTAGTDDPGTPALFNIEATS